MLHHDSESYWGRLGDWRWTQHVANSSPAWRKIWRGNEDIGQPSGACRGKGIRVPGEDQYRTFCHGYQEQLTPRIWETSSNCEPECPKMPSFGESMSDSIPKAGHGLVAITLVAYRGMMRMSRYDQHSSGRSPNFQLPYNHPPWSIQRGTFLINIAVVAPALS